ncbi:hypothetical protein PG996_006288 [Apiospora saccharicola]|uniref:Uncharacterized protein n=1 Tax=Apiospora saccharicola TaxID=335842 RepID=A0ABR1VNW2_9PEZI
MQLRRTTPRKLCNRPPLTEPATEANLNDARVQTARAALGLRQAGEQRPGGSPPNENGKFTESCCALSLVIKQTRRGATPEHYAGSQRRPIRQSWSGAEASLALLGGDNQAAEAQLDLDFGENVSALFDEDVDGSQ